LDPLKSAAFSSYGIFVETKSTDQRKY